MPATLGGVLAWQFSMPVHAIEIDPFVKYFIGVPCTIAGAVLMAIRKYFFKLSGVQVFYHHKTGPSLETGGVHRFVRHPLYIGTLLLIWGLLFFFPTQANFITCTLITIYVRIGISLQESKLLQIFGDEYINYKRRTPMLIPGIGKLEKDGKSDLGSLHPQQDPQNG